MSVTSYGYDWTQATLKEIVKQLENCKFECEAGNLETNGAFMELKKRSENE